MILRAWRVAMDTDVHKYSDYMDDDNDDDSVQVAIDLIIMAIGGKYLWRLVGSVQVIIALTM